jgi:outer membrane protein OmpA-like peptidoglycan-associated protein
MRLAAILCSALLALSACAGQQPHYSYPPPYEAPVAPPPPSPEPRPAPPAPAYVAQTPQVKIVKPLNVGLLTAKNVGGYMDGEEHDMRVALRGSGVGVSRPADTINLFLRSDFIFEPNSTELSPRAAQIIAAIAAVAQKYDSTALIVNGYTDTTGTAGQDITVSQHRADAVAKALVQAGVDSHRIVSHGLGATHLKIPTGANVSEQRNRRVEILITPKMAG